MSHALLGHPTLLLCSLCHPLSPIIPVAPLPTWQICRAYDLLFFSFSHFPILPPSLFLPCMTFSFWKYSGPVDLANRGGQNHRSNIRGRHIGTARLGSPWRICILCPGLSVYSRLARPFHSAVCTMFLLIGEWRREEDEKKTRRKKKKEGKQREKSVENSK